MHTKGLRRRWLQHVLIVVASVGMTFGFMHLFPSRDFISRVSIGTAYAGLSLTALALILGPVNVLRSKANPISFDLRRDIGIWAGLFAVMHSVVGLNVHLRGKMWLYFVDVHYRLRRDAFGLANYTGTIAALVFVLLLMLSNDISLRSLGTARWKSLQRWAYVGVALTAVHAIAYQQVEKRVPLFRAFLYTAGGMMLVLQLTAAASRWHRVGTEKAS